MTASYRYFAVRILIAATGAACLVASAAAEGCRDGRGRLIYCDEAGGDAAPCIDGRGFEVRCGLPGAKHKDMGSVSSADAETANAGDRNRMPIVRAATQDNDLVGATKLRAAAAARAHEETRSAGAKRGAGGYPQQ